MRRCEHSFTTKRRDPYIYVPKSIEEIGVARSLHILWVKEAIKVIKRNWLLNVRDTDLSMPADNNTVNWMKRKALTPGMRSATYNVWKFCKDQKSVMHFQDRPKVISQKIWALRIRISTCSRIFGPKAKPPLLTANSKFLWFGQITVKQPKLIQSKTSIPQTINQFRMIITIFILKLSIHAVIESIFSFDLDCIFRLPIVL